MTPGDRRSGARGTPGVAMLPWPDRFEDFHDRIGVSFESFRDELTGGWLFNYVEAMQRTGMRPVLYYFSARTRGPMRFTHAPTGVPVRVLPSPRLHQKLRGVRERYRPPSEALRMAESYLATPLRPLARQLRADGCAVILCHEYEYPRFDVAVGLGRVLRLPVFATFQGGEEPRHRLEAPMRRFAVRGAAGLIIPSSAQAEVARRRYRLSTDRIATIPNPIDVDRWTPVPKEQGRAELGISPDAVVVTWQGRVSIDQKGLDVLLEAWTQVCETHRDLTPLLLLVGHGQDDEGLRSLIHSSPDGTVRWVDRYVKDREELWRYLAAADIAVLPSRREGFPVAAVEAMTCALPVVATDVPAARDALGEGNVAAGIVVPREDPTALAQALGRLIGDPDARRVLGDRGRSRAQDRFSLQAVGERLRAFLLREPAVH